VFKGGIQEHKNNIISIDVFRAQETVRFNRLVKIILKSLADLQKAIKGLVVMSIALERIYNSFINKSVPLQWADAAYPSLKPLSGWIDDLIDRLVFMHEWSTKMGEDGMPSYWVPAFFFPQGFMTAVLQTHARKYTIAIDTLIFRTEVRGFFEDDVQVIPEIGVNMHGLFVQGCRWDLGTKQLEEYKEKDLFPKLPCIWIEPITLENYTQKGTYQAPLYKTSERRGTLSTTGHSTNFVLFLDLAIMIDPVHWVRRGVAMLCQLDN
jgi:dynein heavy chain